MSNVVGLLQKVVHQVGVIDNVTGLRQVGVMPAARAWPKDAVGQA